jgi:hypothetical protein
LPTLTLQNLRDRACLVYDVTSTGASPGRYPNTTLDSLINTAIQAYTVRKQLLDAADTTRTTLSTSSSTSVVSATGFPANEHVVLPSDYVSLESVYLAGTNSRIQLQALAESDRYDWTTLPMGPPTHFATAHAKDGSDILRLWPPCAAVYTLEVIYQNTPTSLSASGDFWNYIYGTEDAVVCDVAIRLAEMDGIPEPDQYRSLQTRREEAYGRMAQLLSSQDNGVWGMRDTETIDKTNVLRARWLR